MFASRKKKEIEIKDEDGVVIVTIRKLSADSLEEAQEIRSAKALKNAAAIANLNLSADVEKAIEQARERKAQAEEDPAVAAAAKYARFDRATVLRAGIESWTATKPDPKKPEREIPVPVETGVSDLDETAATLLFRAIVDLSVEDPKAVEEAAGKETSLSTSS